jgi:hypothetical protein
VSKQRHTRKQNTKVERLYESFKPQRALLIVKCITKLDQVASIFPAPQPHDLGTVISKFAALVATPTRPWRSTSCGDRSPRRSMNWNATCAEGLLTGTRLSLQAQPSGRAADNEDINERPAIDLVAEGAIRDQCTHRSGLRFPARG